MKRILDAQTRRRRPLASLRSAARPSAWTSHWRSCGGRARCTGADERSAVRRSQGRAVTPNGQGRGRKPTHPGAVLREDVLPALRMSQREMAGRLGVSRLTLGALLAERRDLSTELAARIAKLLGHSAERWIRMQVALDLWRIAQDPRRLAGIEPLPRRVMEV